MCRIGNSFARTAAFLHERLEELKERCASCLLRLAFFRHRLGEVLDNNSNSLATRILLLQLGWALAVYLLVIVALWFTSSAVIEKSLGDQGEAWVTKLDELGTPLYVSEEPSRLSEIVSDLHKFPEIASMEYLDANGQVIAHYARQGVALTPFPPMSKALLEQLRQTDTSIKPLFHEDGPSQRIRISAPIWIKSIPSDGMLDFKLDEPGKEITKVIGFLSVVLDYSNYYQELHRTLSGATILIALLMILTAIVGRILIRWSLIPLSRLELPLSRLANGETDVTVESSGDREIAKIGMALNSTINALRERDEILRHMANHDALTGLVNRNCFTEQLEREVRHIASRGGSSALFFIDLDRFKLINDTYGHAAGDRLLTQVAGLLKQRLREGDLLARFGGDEFVALVPGVNAGTAKEIAASLIELAREFEFHEGDEILRINLSIGVTLIRDEALSAQDYILQADRAMRTAKAAGRNGYRCFEPGARSRPPGRHGGWYERLRGAIDKQELKLFFQPLYPLREQGETVYEVLLRLPDSHAELVRPGAFFPAAERFGLMSAIDRQVISRAIAILKQPENRDSVLSLNLSSQIFLEEDFISFLEGVISDSGVDGRRLIFEVSEHLAFRHIEPLKLLFEHMNTLGIRLAIDDFGSGLAWFKYLKQLPVQWLKIDGALIERLQGDRIDQITVRSIAEAAAELGIETVAKFVADEPTLRLLREIGIGYAQGDFLGRPGPEMNQVAIPQLKVVR